MLILFILFFTALLMFCWFMKFVVQRFGKLYVAIKNDKYLVGQRLVNYDHRKRASRESSTVSSGSAAAPAAPVGAGEGVEAL